MSDASPRPVGDPPAAARGDQPGTSSGDRQGQGPLPGLAELRAARPWEAGAARLLALLLVAVIWPSVSSYASSDDGTGPSFIYLVVFVAEVLFVFAAFGVAQGRDAGRFLAIITTAVIWIVLAPYAWIGWADPGIDGRLAAGAAVLAVIGSLAVLALMYAPRTNAYVTAVTAALVRQGRRTFWPF